MTCCKRVYPSGLAFARGHLCGKRAKCERDGKWYCGRHDPVVVKKRADARYAVFAADLDTKLHNRELLQAKLKIADAVLVRIPFFSDNALTRAISKYRKLLAKGPAK